MVFRHLILLLLFFPLVGIAAEEPLFELSSPLPDVEPNIDRKDIVIPNIDTEYFEVGLVSGIVSVEDFGSHFSYGVQASIHITQSFFFKAKGGLSKVSDNVFRRLGVAYFDDDGTRQLTQMSLLLGWDALPGEVYIGDDYTVSSATFFQLGASSIKFGNEDYFGVSGGMGLRIMPVDWVAVTIEVLGTEYNSTIFGFKKVSHNFESHFGLSMYF